MQLVIIEQGDGRQDEEHPVMGNFVPRHNLWQIGNIVRPEQASYYEYQETD